MNSTAKYSIKNLESLTGILSHTIRIWEKRYQILTPERTDTNLRLYSDEDLRKLLNVSFLNESGIKISAIAKMSDEEIREKVLEAQQSSDSQEQVIKSLTRTMLDLNEKGLNDLLDQFIGEHGLQNTIEKIVFPFFIRIGFMWQTGSINPAQEHFVSFVIRQKLIAATSALPPAEDPEKKPVVFFLPENELHELSLLYYHYILRAHGARTLYLGQAVPLDSLTEIIRLSGCDTLVFTSTSFMDKGKEDDILVQLENSGVNCFCSGMQMKDKDLGPYSKITYFESADQLLKLFTKFGN